MDFLTNTEVNIFRTELEAGNAAVEVDKMQFLKMMENGLGKEMENALRGPEVITEKPGEWELI